MILGGEAIRERLKNGDIFRSGTWDDSSIKEASYALRIANDGLLIDGKISDPKKPIDSDYIQIDPGAIAILSTIERLVMPRDLVGRIGIRLDYALQGLTGLMGIQVDPLYGRDKPDERLFMRVANFGNEPIRLSPGDRVFTFEVQKVEKIRETLREEDTWSRIKRLLRHQSNLSWSYVTRVENDLSKETANIKEYLQPLVMFGIFLLAVTILGASLAVLLSMRETPSAQVPDWFTNWAWILLMLTLGIAAIATAAMGFAITIAGTFSLFAFLRKK